MLCVDDFKIWVLDGGCIVLCVKLFKCGYVCEMFCYLIDLEYENYDCNKLCIKKKI